MSWSLKFDELIELSKGKPLRTLRDAATHILALSKPMQSPTAWQLAAEIAMRRALNGEKLEPPPVPRQKSPGLTRSSDESHRPWEMRLRRAW